MSRESSSIGVNDPIRAFRLLQAFSTERRLRPLRFLSLRCQHLTTFGHPATARRLSSCGGYMRPSVRQFSGTFEMLVSSSSTCVRVSARRRLTSSAFAEGGASESLRNTSRKRSFFEIIRKSYIRRTAGARMRVYRALARAVAEPDQRSRRLHLPFAIRRDRVVGDRTTSARSSTTQSDRTG